MDRQQHDPSGISLARKFDRQYFRPTSRRQAEGSGRAALTLP